MAAGVSGGRPRVTQGGAFSAPLCGCRHYQMTSRMTCNSSCTIRLAAAPNESGASGTVRT